MSRWIAIPLFVFAACSAPQPEPARESVPVVVAIAPPAVPSRPARTWSPPPALDAKPAAVPMPAAPPLQRADSGTGRDQSGELGRNASVVGRLPEPGQRASFPFECEPGEQSLFEIVAYGYSRASAGRVRLSIEDTAGAVAWQSERDVAVVWRDFAAFAPASPGPWIFSLTVLEGGYRFVLVRHSDYPLLTGSPLELGERNLVHGHLPKAEAVASFLVPVFAGGELAVKLTGTREEARAEAQRGATDMAAMMARMDARPGGGRMAGGERLLFQSFDLEVTADGLVLGPIGPYLRFKAPRDGSVEVRVRARRPGLGGGLFDLSVERSLKLLHVRGVVVDSEDQPLSGVEVEFLREPDADPVGHARTNAAGEYDAAVLGGNLAVQMILGRTAARESVRVQVEADLSLDLLFEPGAKLRGR